MSLEKLKKIINKKIDKDFTHDLDFIYDTIGNLKLDRNSKILDIGTGYGIMATILALHDLNILTGEPEHDPLRDKYYSFQSKLQRFHNESNSHNHRYSIKFNWRELARQMDVENKIKYSNLNAQHLDFPDKSFDAIFMYDTLQHIEDKKLALKEILRILDKNGILCVVETNQNGINYYKKHYGFNIDLVDPRIILKEKNILTKVIEGKFTNFYILKKGYEF